MSVSILIPAYRPTFLGQAIASALTQGFEDYELIVSDDSGGDDVRAVVGRFADPRIRYRRTAGRTGAVNNCRELWAEAQRPLIKYLFDDDVLMPAALVTLLDGLERHPEASYVFGQRYTMDERGFCTAARKSVNDESVVPVSYSDLCRVMVARVHNPIGEFSNVLMNRAAGVEADDFLAFAGVELEILGDVAFYLNAARRSPAVGVGRVVSGFRRHDHQQSSQAANPRYAKAYAEWEVFVRGSWAAGELTREDALQAIGKLAGMYPKMASLSPELALLHPLLEGFRRQVEAGDRDVLDAEFQSAWSALTAALEARHASRALPDRPQVTP